MAETAGMNTGTGTPAPQEIRRQELAALLERAQGGDRVALEEIVARLMPLVWNVARAQNLDHETASDVAQTVWLTLLQHIGDIRTSRALASWLVTVTRREARRVRAAQRRCDPVEQQELDRGDPTVDIESAVTDSEQYRSLWRNLRRLSPRCQELLRIVAFTDRPCYAAVSEALGMPKGSIGPIRGRCLSRLRTLLTNDPTWSAP
jgi:RNA polymerase sigma factor (sigma-70 family)